MSENSQHKKGVNSTTLIMEPHLPCSWWLLVINNICFLQMKCESKYWTLSYARRYQSWSFFLGRVKSLGNDIYSCNCTFAASPAATTMLKQITWFVQLFQDNFFLFNGIDGTNRIFRMNEEDEGRTLNCWYVLCACVYGVQRPAAALPCCQRPILPIPPTSSHVSTSSRQYVALRTAGPTALPALWLQYPTAY